MIQMPFFQLFMLESFWFVSWVFLFVWLVFVCFLPPPPLWDPLHFMGIIALENGRKSCGTFYQPALQELGSSAGRRLRMGVNSC